MIPHQRDVMKATPLSMHLYRYARPPLASEGRTEGGEVSLVHRLPAGLGNRIAAGRLGPPR